MKKDGIFTMEILKILKENVSIRKTQFFLFQSKKERAMRGDSWKRVALYLQYIDMTEGRFK